MYYNLSVIFATGQLSNLDFNFLGQNHFNSCYQRNHTFRNHKKKCHWNC